MKQPDLGKKIAELRKAQGLTQEELVEKCNLNVRTLQRIESGEVMPRSYTIRLIFSALGFIDSSNDSSFKLSNEKKANEGTGQFYKYVFDLFKLKTKAMKKSIVLPFLILAIGLVVFFGLLGYVNINKVDKADLVGTWQICNMKTGQVDTCYGGQCGLIRYKIITPAKFMNVDIVPAKKIMFGAFSGGYDVANEVYTESIELTHPNYYSYLGQKNDFNIRLKDDILYIKGINNHYDEMWKRVKE